MTRGLTRYRRAFARRAVRCGLHVQVMAMCGRPAPRVEQTFVSRAVLAQRLTIPDIHLYTLSQDEYPSSNHSPQPNLQPSCLLLLASPSGLTVGRLRWVRDGEAAAGRREAEEFDSSAFLLAHEPDTSGLFPAFSTSCPVVIRAVCFDDGRTSAELSSEGGQQPRDLPWVDLSLDTPEITWN